MANPLFFVIFEFLTWPVSAEIEKRPEPVKAQGEQTKLVRGST
jgi:hypothetical protein